MFPRGIFIGQVRYFNLKVVNNDAYIIYDVYNVRKCSYVSSRVHACICMYVYIWIYLNALNAQQALHVYICYIRTCIQYYISNAHFI